MPTLIVRIPDRQVQKPAAPEQRLTELPDTGALPDAMEPDFHGVRTQWIRGFMTFQLARRTRAVMLMVPACPESGSLGRAARPPPLADRDTVLMVLM
jgi:hypothetical protein